MNHLDDIRRARRDLTDLRREVVAHEHALEVAIASARDAGASEANIRTAAESP